MTEDGAGSLLVAMKCLYLRLHLHLHLYLYLHVVVVVVVNVVVNANTNAFVIVRETVMLMEMVYHFLCFCCRLDEDSMVGELNEQMTLLAVYVTHLMGGAVQVSFFQYC